MGLSGWHWGKSRPARGRVWLRPPRPRCAKELSSAYALLRSLPGTGKDPPTEKQEVQDEGHGGASLSSKGSVQHSSGEEVPQGNRRTSGAWGQVAVQPTGPHLGQGEEIWASALCAEPPVTSWPARRTEHCHWCPRQRQLSPPGFLQEPAPDPSLGPQSPRSQRCLLEWPGLLPQHAPQPGLFPPIPSSCCHG